MNAACERFVPLIVRSADGTLPPEKHAELDAHVATCEGCREVLREQSAVRQLLQAVELTPATRGFAERVRLRAVPEPGLIDLLNWRSWSLRLAPVAAVLALLAWYPASTASTVSTSDTLPGIVDEWAGTQAQVAGGVLGIGPNASSDKDALLAAALGESSR